MPLADQLVTLSAVGIGAEASYLATSFAERARHRRELSGRWEERRFDVYRAYITQAKEVVGIARRLAAARGLEINEAPLDMEADLALLIAAEDRREALTEPMTLLAGLLGTSFAGYLEDKLGHNVSRHAIFLGGGAPLRTDYHDQTNGVLYEAKASATRNHVRMAVAQLLEYQFHLAEGGDGVRRLALLLPALPSQDQLNWLRHLNIWVAYPDGDGFTAWPDTTIFNPEKELS